jgi:membrane protease subunit HflK
VFVDAGEQVVLEHFGKPVDPPLTAGAHFKLPWPVDKAYRYRTEQIQTIYVGFTPDAGKDEQNVILWTVAHNQEQNFLVGNRATATVQTDNTDTNDSLKAATVSLITVSIPVQFQITNVMDWAYQNGEPTNLLADLATREVVHYLAGVDLGDLLSHARLDAARILQERIQADANAYRLGAKILFVGLQDVHPPTTVAGDYEKVVGAEQTKLAKILDAKADAIRTNALAEALAFTTTNLADTAREQLEVSAFASAALFTNQIPAFDAAPSVYMQRAYFGAFADATKNARKYILLVTNTQDVIIFNLEDSIARDMLNINVPHE